jgi:uncharacterized protein YcbK (DUF882 family)
MPKSVRLARRSLLGVGAATMALLARPVPARVARPRSLSFLHLHTGERLSAVYFADGSYLREGLDAIDHVLRDHRTGEVKPIDPDLLDLVHELTGALGSASPIEVISGYRSPATNAMLAARSGGVARHSLHMDGMAIDLRLGDVRLSHLRDAALALQGGGVGYYPRSDFVHVDTGRVRSW